MVLQLQPYLQDKIFEIRLKQDNMISKIVSYFPLTDSEKHKITSTLQCGSIAFHSIFSDTISDEQWNMTKHQIKKKFNDELFRIDDTTAKL